MSTGTIILYAYYEGGETAEEFAEFLNDSDYKASFRKYLDMKKKEGKSLADYDKLMTDCLFYGVKIKRAGFKKLTQALRHFDEIGVSNEIYDVMQEIIPNKKIVAVSLGTPGGRETDFGEYTI